MTACEDLKLGIREVRIAYPRAPKVALEREW